MNKTFYTFIIILLINLAINTNTYSTPSTQIWIASTDFQKFKTFHLGIDDFIRVHNVLNANGETTRGSAMYDFGLTAGILPWKNFQGEIGIDYISMGDYIYDQHPLYFNLKVGTPEDVLFKGAPAFAFGAYNFGTKTNLTDYNIIYGVAAKTFKSIGRLTAGYYFGNKKVLLDENLKPQEKGLLISWDRQMNEISDKLWLGIDYQGGKNYLSSLNFGIGWSFSSNVTVIAGYCVYNNPRAYYNSKDINVNTFTTQVDINF